MKLKSFNYFIGLLIIFFYSPLWSEEKIDIWKSKKEIATDSAQQKKKDNQGKPNLTSSQTIKTMEKIQIEETSQIQSDEQVVYGIYEPANFDFNLNIRSKAGGTTYPTNIMLDYKTKVVDGKVTY